MTCVVSPKEELIYALGEDGTAHCFSIASGARKSALRVHDSNALGICHHPRQNILASFAKQDSPSRVEALMTKTGGAST